MTELTFSIRRNLKKAPRIYVMSVDTTITYGAFSAENLEEFDGWNDLTENQKIELQFFMQNIKAVKNHLGTGGLNELQEFRLRIPANFDEAMKQISLICAKSNVEIDLFDPIIATMIQQTKIAITKLSQSDKTKALAILDQIALAEYKKMDYSAQKKAIFAELTSVPSVKEKLHKQAMTLFEKDKFFPAKSIAEMAKGNPEPAMWLTACGIEVLANEKLKLQVLRKMLSDDDLFMLWAKPLIDNNQKKIAALLAEKHGFNSLQARIQSYTKPQPTKK